MGGGIQIPERLQEMILSHSPLTTWLLPNVVELFVLSKQCPMFRIIFKVLLLRKCLYFSWSSFCIRFKKFLHFCLELRIFIKIFLKTDLIWEFLFLQELLLLMSWFYPSFQELSMQLFLWGGLDFQ